MTTAGPWQAIQTGWRAVLTASPAAKACLFGLSLLFLLMAPFGRSGPNDMGGILAPLTADSSIALHRMNRGVDFYSVYDAGARLLAGRDPYGVNEDTGGPGFRAPKVATFRYLPITAAWLSAPLNVLPPFPAYTTWSLLSMAMVVANFLLCVGRRPDHLLTFAVIWFAWFPLIAELHMGQFTLFLSTLLLWAFDGWFSGAKHGGAAWAFAVFLKVYPIAMAPSLWFWGKRRTVLITVILAVGTTIAWRVIAPSGIDKGMVERGIAGRVIGSARLPYAGAQGVQEFVNATVWKARGLTFQAEAQTPQPDPVFIINAIILSSFALLTLWVLIRTRKEMRPEAVGLFWLIWFYAYYDCWEHHYLLFQGLLAFLLIQRVLDWRMALALYLFAGGPSLWWFWQRSGYAGSWLPELIGWLYFAQRPVAVIGLTALLAAKLARRNAVED